ncbi:MAG: efflux RND transporter periplasmic adaptor subunit [Sphaerochaetaceae bacterium]|jgi:membrane fusion protein (multidrug efflux system)
MSDQQQNTEIRVRASLKKKLRRKRIKRFIIWIIILALLGGGVYLYQFYKTHGKLPFSDQQQGVALSTSTMQEAAVQQIEFTQTIDISGVVEAYDTQRVVFRSTGAVTGVFVKGGEQVSKGQLLATIDDTSQSYSLANIESQIEEAQLQGSVRQLELLKQQKKMAENNLDYTKAYANFTGVVAEVNVDEGDYFEAGTAAMIIIDRSSLKATVEIDEIDIQSVTEGMKAELTFDALPGQTIEATVNYIPMLGRTTNQGIGVLDVEILIENPPAALVPGFTFAGTISSEETKKMLVVPSAAVTAARRGPDTVNKKGADGKAVTVQVTTHYLGEGMSEIVSGDLKEGDIVLYGTNNNPFRNLGMPAGGAMRMGF